MFKQLPKSVVMAGVALSALVLVLVAVSRPYYFNQTYIGGLILLEFMAAALWKFRQVFFPLVILVFLFAGSAMPANSVWTASRWVFLAVGAIAGFLLFLRERKYSFGVFHVIALFAVVASAVSAIVSRYPSFALLKALSLFLLFLYSASGVRLAVRGREQRFFSGLLLGCEIMVGVFVVSYLVVGAQIMGNPNSLGAITGVAVAPLLLWGAMVSQDVSIRRRRWLMFACCMVLVFYSHSRASMVAAALSCGLLCIGLRRYRSLVVGVSIALFFLTTAALLNHEVFSETATSVSSEVIYKGVSGNGVLASRTSPWQEAVDTIQSHFWFGTGFGTIDKGGGDVSQHLGNFASTTEVTSEYGSSYLEIATWVGMLGVVPFFLLLLILVSKVFQTVVWMFRARSAEHFAIPLALVLVGGLVHAAFEDWMFAPGYYLCVFFWAVAFLLVDLAPPRAAAPATRRPAWFSRPLRTGLGTPAPTR